MIKPLESLAFSLRENRGRFALLLGSGVSRGAGIPTGWEITCDLVCQLAKSRGESPAPSPEAWYQRTEGKSPSYSELIGSLFPKPAEQQGALRKYFERSPEDAPGVKQPTKAHQSIAWLAKRKFVSVIITTNFDRLIEGSLDSAGVTNTVLSTVDQIRANPLSHIVQSACCVLKLHGDYLDSQILNTNDELQEYRDERKEYLDEILRDYGLIVCGWSAAWDGALCDAISRAGTGRYSTYWAVNGEPSEEACRLIKCRGASRIAIKDADSFFETVKEQVELLDMSTQSHSPSIQSPIERLKPYCGDSSNKIGLQELLLDEVNEAVEAMSDIPRETIPETNGAEYENRVSEYWQACRLLLEFSTIGGYYCSESFDDAWLTTLMRLADRTPGECHPTIWPIWQRLPALLFLYCLGLGAVAGDKWKLLGKVFSAIIPSPDIDYPTVVYLHPAYLRPRENYIETKTWEDREPPLRMDRYSQAGRLLGPQERISMNEWLRDKTAELTGTFTGSSEQHNVRFAKLEILMHISYQHQVPPGVGAFPFWGLAGDSDYTRKALDEIVGSVAVLARSGIADTSPDGWKKCTKEIRSLVV